MRLGRKQELCSAQVSVHDRIQSELTIHLKLDNDSLIDTNGLRSDLSRPEDDSRRLPLAATVGKATANIRTTGEILRAFVIVRAAKLAVWIGGQIHGAANNEHQAKWHEPIHGVPITQPEWFVSIALPFESRCSNWSDTCSF